MKSPYNYFFLFLITFCISACGIHSSRNEDIPLIDLHDDPNCYHNGNLSEEERLQFYPFNQATTIHVISFNAKLGAVPLLNDTLIHTKVLENIELNASQVNQLTDVLYNYNYSDETNGGNITQSGCYYPRHGILFYDASEKVFAYIELCLECREIKTNLPENSLGEFCTGKYDLLKGFLSGVGITYFGE